MLFFSCKVSGRYAGRMNLEKVFEKSRREAESAVCKINEALCDELDEGRCAFIYSGTPGAWHVAVAFNAKENFSAQRLKKFLEVPFKIKAGMDNISVTDIQEITAKDFGKAIGRADDLDFLGNRRVYDVSVDYFRNFTFKVREEMQDKTRLSKKKVQARAREILADQTLLDEIERIFSDENVTRFHGHPVHYKIIAESQEAAMVIVRLLAEALYSRGRLLGRRISLVSEIGESCYDESDMEAIFDQAAGTTLAIELRGSNEEHGNYASAFEQVTQFISRLVKKHHRDVLCVFIERTDNPGFTPSLMSKVEEDIDIIEIYEGAGDRKDATEYLRRLVKSADFQVMDDEEIKEAISERNSFTASTLHHIFNKFYKDGLKNKLYRAYKTAKYIAVEKKELSGDAYARLQKMIGLSEVKRVVDQVIAAHKVQKMRIAMGLGKQKNALHMLFTGNPGSAKTTVARLLSEILKKEGVLESGEFVECGRSDLVGQFVGWTAPLVKQKFRQARGGILFIDEAYSLVDDRDGSYGDEAISTIVQEMENHRDDVIVIFAGYTDKMKRFLMKNEGLRSRITFHINFPDYNADELTEILSLLAEDRGYSLGEATLRKCRTIFADACKQTDFGNGRFARNLLEQAIMKQSQRIMGERDGHEVSREEILALVPEDFEVNAKRYGQEERFIGFCG